MSFGAVAIGTAVVSAGLGVAKAIKGNSEKRAAKKENEKAKAEMEKDKERYMNMDTSNPYLNMENTMEDLTVNTQAAEFEAEQNQIGMANTMANMNKAAGGSGIAALAQAMANQGQIANQKASISIADQEKSNQMAEKQEASRLQGLEREGEIQSRNLKQSLAGKALELSAGEVARTEQDIKDAEAKASEGWDQVGSAAGNLIGSLSDIRSKENIVELGYSPSGIPIYSFNYKGNKKLYSGTMAQDLIELGREDAVMVMENGYYAVNYDIIDVDMLTLN